MEIQIHEFSNVRMRGWRLGQSKTKHGKKRKLGYYQHRTNSRYQFASGTPQDPPVHRQLVCVIGPQCIILPDFQQGGIFLLFIVFLVFEHLFYTKMLYLESVRVTKSGFGIELLTFRVCQGNLWHFSNKVKSSHFSLCLIGRTFWSLMAFRYWCLA